MNNIPQKTSKNTEKIILKPSKREIIFLFFRDFFTILGILALVSFFFIMPFRINGHSMENNYHNGEYILIDRFSYLDFSTHFSDWQNENAQSIVQFFGNLFAKIPVHIGDPKRGDVIVIELEIEGKKQYYLKRIIGLPGETIRISDGNVFIRPKNSHDFIQLSEWYLSDENNHETYLPFNIHETDFSMPEGSYWVMGDNRKNSSDSRSCFYLCTENSNEHFIRREKIVGKMLANFWHFEIFEENNFPKFGSFSWKHPPRWFNIPKDFTYPELSSYVLPHK